MFYSLLRPLLFSLPPEASHHLTLTALRLGLGHCYWKKPALKPVTLWGLNFPNPVGLAAGLDKNGDCIDGLASLGFGFIEVGTVTPRPQIGNPQPRLFRLSAAQALINRMGFNNKGVDYLVAAVGKSRYQGVLGINIGKNKDTPADQAVDDYLCCLEKVHDHADYVVMNVSSPNTPGLRNLQHGESLRELLGRTREAQARLDQKEGRRVPLLVKVAPDNDEAAFASMAEAFLTAGIDGVIVGNTTLERPEVENLVHGNEVGGLSGRPLLPLANRALEQMSHILAGRLPIIGTGGIACAGDVTRKQELGASLVQVYSGLIYQGPGLVTKAVTGWR
jgi:dihydroorotate dehydrogenase